MTKVCVLTWVRSASGIRIWWYGFATSYCFARPPYSIGHKIRWMPRMYTRIGSEQQ